MDYTVTVTPPNWTTFLNTSPYRFGFRETMIHQLVKLSVGDRLVVYLAQEMSWSGVFRITKPVYKTDLTIYPSEPAFNMVIEVEEIYLPKNKNYVSIKTPELWDRLDRFLAVDHTKSGWIYKAQLSRSLCRMSSNDTDKIIDYLRGI